MPKRRLPLQFHSRADVLVLRLRRRIQSISASPQSPQDHLRLLDTSCFDQPARTLGHKEDQNHEREHWYDLESEREPPAKTPCPVTHKADAVFEPVGGDQTDIVEGEFERDEEAADVFMRSLGGPDGEDSIKDSSAHTSDDTGAENPRAVHGASLECVSMLFGGRTLQCQESENQKFLT